MTLDVFQESAAGDIAFAREHLAQDLPATFAEAFEAAWRAGIEFGNSDAEGRARIEGVQEFVNRVRQRTGVTLSNPAFGGGAATLEEMNRQIAQLAPKFPDLDLKPLTAADLDEMGAARSRQAREAQQRMAGREQTWGSVAGSVLGNVAASALDPINLVTVPLAAPRALGILGTALATAGITGGTQLGIEAVTARYKEDVAPGYAASGEVAENVLGAAVAGGVLGGGAKALGAVWARWQTGEWPRHIRDAGNVAASEAQIAATNALPGVEGEIAHRTALQAAIDAMVSGRAVDSRETVAPSLLRGYEGRLAPVMESRAAARLAEQSVASIEREGARLPPTVERLSEMQLADIRATSRAVDTEAAGAIRRIEAETASIAAQRVALVERGSTTQALREEVDGLRADLGRVEARLAETRPPTDPETQGRLDAIDGDLRASALSAERRAELEAERASIAETLSTTAPGDARLAVSLQEEAKGLRRALSRQEKALDRAAAFEARTRAKLDKVEAALPGRRSAAETRATGRRDVAATEMRKAVSKLALEGYGVRLPRDDAEAFAGRILRAGDDELDSRLRELTETLVDRRLEAQRGQPAEAPGIERPNAAAEQRSRAGYHVDKTRKRVQALAREVGYEMPRDEAAGIASAIVRAPTDDEAGAILDELLLRPRTLAATLPGTDAARLEKQGGGGLDRPPEARTEQIAALAEHMTPAGVAAARRDPMTDEAVLHDLDKLRALGDRQVPVGERLNDRGELEADMRSIDALLDEADARLSAAREVAACALPQPEPVT